MELKCISCDLDKEISLFEYKNRHNNIKYRKKCKECFLLDRKKTYLKNKENIDDNSHYQNLLDRRLKYAENREEILEKKKLYYQSNRDSEIKRVTNYNKSNIDKVRERNKEYKRNRLIIDPLYRLKSNISRRIRRCMKNKSNRTYEILGCSPSDFKLYIESKFEHWMSWDNYGKYNGDFNHGWDLDHITPISSAINEEAIISLNHYKNLQPLCSKVNRDIKRDFFIKKSNLPLITPDI